MINNRQTDGTCKSRVQFGHHALYLFIYFFLLRLSSVADALQSSLFQALIYSWHSGERKMERISAVKSWLKSSRALEASFLASTISERERLSWRQPLSLSAAKDLFKPVEGSTNCVASTADATERICIYISILAAKISQFLALFASRRDERERGEASATGILMICV